MDETTTVFTSRDGIEIQTYLWAPDGSPTAVVQVQHGLAEHAGRYRRFAEASTDAGYLVYAPDARGSGRTAGGDYGNWGEDGWPGWVNDVALLGERIRRDHLGLALGLFAHSMESFATQQYLLDHSGDVDAVVLSGSTEVGRLVPVLDATSPPTSAHSTSHSRTGPDSGGSVETRPRWTPTWPIRRPGGKLRRCHGSRHSPLRPTCHGSRRSATTCQC